MKKMYNAPQMECVMLSTADVIATSFLALGVDAEENGKFGAIQSIRNRL